MLVRYTEDHMRIDFEASTGFNPVNVVKEIKFYVLTS